MSIASFKPATPGSHAARRRVVHLGAWDLPPASGMVLTPELSAATVQVVIGGRGGTFHPVSSATAAAVQDLLDCIQDDVRQHEEGRRMIQVAAFTAFVMFFTAVFVLALVVGVAGDQRRP